MHIPGSKGSCKMIIVLLALIGAIIIVAILTIGRLVFGRREVFNARKFGRWFLGYFIFNFILSLGIIYVSEPAFTGPFGGWQWILGPLVLSSIANLFAYARPAMTVLNDISAAGQGRSSSSSTIHMPTNASRGAVAAGIFGLVFAAVIGIVVSGLIVVFTTWFDSNAKALAAIPQVTMEKTATLPPTDPNHIVLVSENVAAYKGQQVLGANGQNLGSTYSIDPTSYTLQSINHHLYYVAPLSYNNIFVNLSNSSTPGFVVVDAEDPQAIPQLHTESGASIAYLPGALLNQDLVRHVYLSGYTYGRLVDPTLELDDSYHPYWTISLMQPTRGYTGDALSEVLIVNAHTGEITKYAPKDVPSWVDRVFPADTVSEYLSWWGLYHSAPWFNPSGQGQQTPASSPQLLYNYVNNVDQPVWLVPMTSASANDNSSTGIFLYNTHKNQGSFYPLSGVGVGGNVQSTFQSTNANIRNYDVASIQLYQIYNTPTWVATYVRSSSSGDIYQAVGLVDARNLNGSNVQFNASLPQALQSYQQWLSQQGNGNGGTPTGGNTHTVTGKVQRISSIQQGSNTIYYLQIAGQNTIFTANLGLSPKLPLVQAGDTVTGTYFSSGNNVINLNTFDDTSINLQAPVGPGTPTPIPSPVPTPALTPTATPKK